MTDITPHLRIELQELVTLVRKLEEENKRLRAENEHLKALRPARAVAIVKEGVVT